MFPRDSTIYLWHSHLDHMSEKELKILNKKNLKMNGIPINFCDHFLIGKQYSALFASSSTSKTELFQLVHTDVCGLIEVKSLDGLFYFLTIIDDVY